MDGSNESLLNAMREAAISVSYFKAAEESQFGSEPKCREIALSRWNALKAEAIRRGIYNKRDWKFHLVPL